MVVGVEVIRLVWCAIALGTLGVALRVWWPIRCAARLAARGSDRRLAVWSHGLANALLGMVVVAALNLTAGVYSAAIPTRPDAVVPPRSMVDWAPLVVPGLFIASALVKLSIVVGVWRAYRGVVSGHAPPRGVRPPVDPPSHERSPLRKGPK